MGMEIDWSSFVIGGLVTWFLMLVACAVTRALEKIASSYPKVEEATAGHIELIDAPTVHDFGAPLTNEYIEKARIEGKQEK